MSFGGEPTAEELTCAAQDLVMRLVEPADAPEAFALLTDPRLEHLDPEFVPETPQDFAIFTRQIQRRAFNDDDVRRYQWAVRLTSGPLVGLITADLHVRTHPPGARAAEISAFFHPDHQTSGHFPVAARCLLDHLQPMFGLTHHEALIRWGNHEAQAMAVRYGLRREPSRDADGYETWVAALPSPRRS